MSQFCSVREKLFRYTSIFFRDKKMSTLDYDRLSHLIKQQRWWFCAAELHGILTALIAIDAQNQSYALLSLNAQNKIASELISRLSKNIEDSLSGSDLDFELLLPEEKSLSERAEALAFWAEGFYLALEYTQKINQLDEDCQDFIHDISEIARLDSHLFASEQNEQMLDTLKEHCRMGALMLYAACHRLR